MDQSLDQSYDRSSGTMDIRARALESTGAPSDRDPWGITLCLKLKFPNSIVDPTPYLRRTWLAVCHNHPRLATASAPTFAEGNTANDPTDKVRWLDYTFTVHEKDTALFQTAEDVVKRFPSSILAATCWLPDSAEFFLRISHFLIDGVGIFKLVHSFMLTLTSVIELGLDAKIDSYASDTTAQDSGAVDFIDIEVETALESIPMDIKNIVDSMIDEHAEDLATISLPLLQGSESAPPGNTIRLSKTFDEASSKAIRTICVNRGISIAALMHACIIEICMELSPKCRDKRIVSHMAIDVRRFLPPIYSTPSHLIRPYATLLPFCLSSSISEMTFEQLSETLGSVYRADIRNFVAYEEGKRVGRIRVTPAHLGTNSTLLGALPVDLTPTRAPIFSSLGLVEKLFHREYRSGEDESSKVEIEDVWGSVEMVTHLPAFHAFTFRDTTRLQVCFNESYYEKDFMIGLLEKIENKLLNLIKA